MCMSNIYQVYSDLITDHFRFCSLCTVKRKGFLKGFQGVFGCPYRETFLRFLKTIFFLINLFRNKPSSDKPFLLNKKPLYGVYLW